MRIGDILWETEEFASAPNGTVVVDSTGDIAQKINTFWYTPHGGQSDPYSSSDLADWVSFDRTGFEVVWIPGQ